jgi:Tol biopolymer transport system component
VLYNASALSPNGKMLLLTSNAKYGAQNAALLDVVSKKLSPWVTDTKWEPFSADFSPDGEYFTYVLNASGRADLYLVDQA